MYLGLLTPAHPRLGRSTHCRKEILGSEEALLSGEPFEHTINFCLGHTNAEEDGTVTEESRKVDD